MVENSYLFEFSQFKLFNGNNLFLLTFNLLTRWCIPLLSCSLFSRSVLSTSLQPHGLQHTRLPCPWPSPRVCSYSCPLNWWCHPTISSSVILLPSVFPSIRVFLKESTLHFRWPKYWNFSISPFKEYSGLSSFRIAWFDILAVQGTLKSLLYHHSLSINSLVLSLLYGPTLASVHDYWKNHSFDKAKSLLFNILSR